jgi:para-aminobenzoate synthetase component 1
MLDRDGGALGLPASAVRDRGTWRLDCTPPQVILQQAQVWHDAGLAVAGWLGYELGAALEGVALRPGLTGLPDADLVAFHPQDLQQVLVTPSRPAGQPLADPADLLRQGPALRAQVRQALEAIAAGEVYQVNLSVCAHLPGLDLEHRTLLDLLGALLTAQPVPLAFAWQGADYRLLSGSMERFLTVVGDRVSSRPIKGTAPRHADPERDRELAVALRASAKEVAENTMIVDMVRNDLQRACHWGSVEVPVLLAAEPYATLWHLESEVSGTLRDPQLGGRLLEATLPPASVTGCPKVQAMHVIARLEQRRRGPYCGTAGVWLPDGRAEWSVGIRQVVLDHSGARLSVGAGIVADSDPEREWEEIRLKAQGALRWLTACQGQP